MIGVIVRVERLRANCTPDMPSRLFDAQVPHSGIRGRRLAGLTSATRKTVPALHDSGSVKVKESEGSARDSNGSVEIEVDRSCRERPVLELGEAAAGPPEAAQCRCHVLGSR